MDFSNTLIIWYKEYGRDLPWRHTKDSYSIWVSEIILQQTRVEQGIAYYHRFLENFPTISALAAATQSEVLRVWQGLGYYSRARHMHQAAQKVLECYNGQFPTNYQQLITLPGIGDYTASAISSFAAGEHRAAVDGNVYRILSRVFNEHTAIDSSAGQKIFKKLANQVLNVSDPGMHNQAMMDFGATQCLPQNPRCFDCPLADACLGKEQAQILPVKLHRTQQRQRYFYYLDFVQGNKHFVRQRAPHDIWQGLYEFYLVEREQQDDWNTWILEHLPPHSTILSVLPQIRHVLSHQIIYTTFIKVALDASVLSIAGYQAVDPDQLNALPKPALLLRYLQTI